MWKTLAAILRLLNGEMQPMQCPKCQHENPPGAKFCVECASPIARRCPACGTETPPTAKFCPECAASLTAKSQAATPDPRAYTPRHLAEKILTSRAALEGERKQVTVLFADVKGSMELAEQLDPEQWHAILDRFFGILTDGVHRFEGTVNQYTGDGIMALFGAPIAHEDHAQRACFTALALLEDLAKYSEQLRREEGLNFSVRLGINSGEVLSAASTRTCAWTTPRRATRSASRRASSSSPRRTNATCRARRPRSSGTISTYATSVSSASRA